MSAQKLGSYQSTDFVLKNTVTACPANNFLTFDGTSFSCAPVTGAAGGTLTDVTSANNYLTVGTGNSTPLLTVNVGTTANTGMFRFWDSSASAERDLSLETGSESGSKSANRGDRTGRGNSVPSSCEKELQNPICK